MRALNARAKLQLTGAQSREAEGADGETRMHQGSKACRVSTEWVSEGRLGSQIVVQKKAGLRGQLVGCCWSGRIALSR